MSNEKSLEALKIAIQTELNGIEFYKIAAEHTEDKKGKEVFKTLANDEEQHFNELKNQFESLLNTGKWTSLISLGEPTPLKGESPIFTEEVKSRIMDKHFEMSALSIGALLESNSVDFYRQMKEEADNEIAKRLFEQLQRWEEGHLDAINKQLNLLREEYWTQAHFAPF